MSASTWVQFDPVLTVKDEVEQYVAQLMDQDHATLIGRAWDISEPGSRESLAHFLTHHFIRFMDFAEGQRA